MIFINRVSANGFKNLDVERYGAISPDGVSGIKFPEPQKLAVSKASPDNALDAESQDF